MACKAPVGLGLGGAALAVAVFCAVGSGTAAAEGLATGDTSDKRIALTNNYAGNAWRQLMLQSWKAAGDEAIGKKLIAEAPSFTTSENSATEQAQQIQNLVLQGFQAIVLDAASPTALNGAVREACDAGIIVVSIDSTVTEPCAWRITSDNHAWGAQAAQYLVKRLDGKGNILEVRGLAGNSVDEAIHGGVTDVLGKNPGVKVVASVNGNWTQSVAQREVAGVLPTLPRIDGVLVQGGDGYGVAQAFEAAEREQPIIVFGNSEDELKWWKALKDKDGYETMSVQNTPGMIQIGFWVAQQILAGRDVPKDLTAPLLPIHQDDLDYWLERTPKGGVTSASYSQEWTSQLIDAAIHHQPPPDTPKE